MSSSCCSTSHISAVLTAEATAAATTTATPRANVEEIAVTVRGGYSPSTIALKAGVPTRLIFNREESSGCSAQLLIPAFGVEKPLPAFTQTVVEFTPTATGTFNFTCGMGMLKGTLVVS
jgi:plastocyanin domain-containing protein